MNDKSRMKTICCDKCKTIIGYAKETEPLINIICVTCGKMSIICKCGNPSTRVAFLPVPNAYAGLHQVVEPEPVCEYHAAKARKAGYEVKTL